VTESQNPGETELAGQNDQQSSTREEGDQNDVSLEVIKVDQGHNHIDDHQDE